MCKLTFHDSQETFEFPVATELLTAYKIQPCMPLKFGCTQGRCGVCAIHIKNNPSHLSPPTKQELVTLKEKYQQGWRLACQCALLGDVEVD